MSDQPSRSDVPDVVIVGAGPSGAVAAKRLAEDGFSVTVLEQGGYPDYTLAPGDQDVWELAKERHFTWNPNNRKAPSDYPVNDSESEVAPLMWNGVGGSSVLYAAAWHRLKPSDFRVRTLDGVADDWPLTYEELAPYYARVERDFAVSGVSDDPAFPEGFDIPLPPLPLSDLDRRFAKAHQELGWHWWPQGNAIATHKVGRLEPCVRRGACMWGCFDGSKASVERTHWPVAIEMGVNLVQHARALRVETDARGLATGVTYVDKTNGETKFQPARVVMLACNGIGTPRLLLNSASATHPDGLANSSGLVGRRLMMHPVSSVVGLFDDFFETWQGPWGQRAYSLEFAETGADRDHVRGAKWQLMGTGGPLNTTGSFPFGGEGAWGPNFHDIVQQRFGRSMYWAILAEDLPEEGNMVTLDSELKDDDGMPAPKMTYATGENTRNLLAFHHAKAEESVRAAGAYDAIIAPIVRDTGWHLMGTTKMGNDPGSSVVDGAGRAHDVENLYVLDGSVMTTSGCVNPTGTVAALALRTTEKLIEAARSQRTSLAHA